MNFVIYHTVSIIFYPLLLFSCLRRSQWHMRHSLIRHGYYMSSCKVNVVALLRWRLWVRTRHVVYLESILYRDIIVDNKYDIIYHLIMTSYDMVWHHMICYDITWSVINYRLEINVGIVWEFDTNLGVQQYVYRTITCNTRKFTNNIERNLISYCT